MTANWKSIARPEQLPPSGDWTVWLYTGGRGAGKTRAASEYITEMAMSEPLRIGVIGSNYIDVRSNMVWGDSGLIACSDSGNRPAYDHIKRTLTWPNGSVAYILSYGSKDEIRGMQFDMVWADQAELMNQDYFFQILFSARRAKLNPKVVLTALPEAPSGAAPVVEGIKACVVSQPDIYTITRTGIANSIGSYINEMRDL